MTTAPAPARRPEPGETLRDTIARLASAQKGAKGVPAYSRFVNRRLGRVLAAVAFHAGLTPNAVTGISAVFTFAGIAALALVAPAPVVGVLIGCALVLGYALDAADGQLARLRGGGSLDGEWLDHMFDALKVSSLHLALLIGLYRFDVVDRSLLLVPLGFSVVGSVHFFGTILNDQLRRQRGVIQKDDTPGERPSVIRSLLVVPTDYGLLCLVFFLYGWPDLFFVAYALLFAVTTGYLLLSSRVWFRAMRVLGSSGPTVRSTPG